MVGAQQTGVAVGEMFQQHGRRQRVGWHTENCYTKQWQNNKKSFFGLLRIRLLRNSMSWEASSHIQSYLLQKLRARQLKCYTAMGTLQSQEESTWVMQSGNSLVQVLSVFTNPLMPFLLKPNDSARIPIPPRWLSSRKASTRQGLVILSKVSNVLLP